MIALSPKALAMALGGEASGNQVLAPAPGHSPRDRSMSVRLSPSAPDGFVTFGHAGDDWRACRDHVRQRLGLSPDLPKRRREAEKPPQASPGSRERRGIGAQPASKPTDDPRIADAATLWGEGVDPRDTRAECYLKARGLQLDQDLAVHVLRWHAGAEAMLALFRNVRSGNPQAVSRTFLDAEARKVERKFLGPVGGAAVMLDGFDAVTGGLHLSEGVESGIAARTLGLKPAWALGSKGAIGAFPVLAGVEALTILAEPDAEIETEKCAARWYAAGREVLINRSAVGKDLADYFRGVAA